MTQNSNNIKVTMTKLAYRKFRYYIEECSAEISGLGKVREKDIEEDGRKLRGFEIYDIELLPQTVGAAHASIKWEDMAKFMDSKMRAKKSIKDYKVWWHSHVYMQAFFSETDTSTMETSTEFPYLISIVGNKQGDMEARLDFHKPIRMHFDIEIEVEDEEDLRLRDQIKNEIAKKVIIQETQYSGRGYHHSAMPDSPADNFGFQDEGFHDWQWWKEKKKPVGFTTSPTGINVPQHDPDDDEGIEDTAFGLRDKKGRDMSRKLKWK